MPDGDRTRFARRPAKSRSSLAESEHGKRPMSVGDPVRVWNGGQSWPGVIHTFPGDGKVVIHGGPQWTGYRAIVREAG